MYQGCCLLPLGRPDTLIEQIGIITTNQLVLPSPVQNYCCGILDSDDMEKIHQCTNGLSKLPMIASGQHMSTIS